MAKLIIEIDCEFKAGSVLHRKNGKLVTMSASNLKKVLHDSTPSDFSLDTLMIDAIENEGIASFEFPNNGLKKGGIFSWSLDESGKNINVKIKGEISTTALRPGVKNFINDKSVLVLSSFNYKGGEWSGFRASVSGQLEDDWKNWFVIDNWKIK